MIEHLVFFSNDLCGFLDAESSMCSGKFEVGGILIGAKRGANLEVTDMTTKGALDISRPFEFIKQDIKHQLYAHDLWERFRKRKSYLGEWHTHPSGSPKPSLQDISTWKSVTAKQGRQMTFVIVAPFEWQPYLVINDLSVYETALVDKTREGKTFSATHRIY